MGAPDDKHYDRKVRQIKKFSTYPEEILSRLEGAKAQFVYDFDGNNADDYKFYVGTILKVKQVDGFKFIFTVKFDGNLPSEDNIISTIDVDFFTASYKNDVTGLTGIDIEENAPVRILVKNKKLRKAIANLLNRKGSE